MALLGYSDVLQHWDPPEDPKKIASDAVLGKQGSHVYVLRLPLDGKLLKSMANALPLCRTRVALSAAVAFHLSDKSASFEFHLQHLGTCVEDVVVCGWRGKAAVQLFARYLALHQLLQRCKPAEKDGKAVMNAAYRMWNGHYPCSIAGAEVDVHRLWEAHLTGNHPRGMAVVEVRLRVFYTLFFIRYSKVGASLPCCTPSPYCGRPHRQACHSTITLWLIRWPVFHLCMNFTVCNNSVLWYWLHTPVELHLP